MRKRIPVKFSGKAYRRWLKTLTLEALQTPVEEACSSLAKQLNEMLIRHGKGWDENDEHLSHALRLVEVTFPAIAGALRDRERSELSEAWAQQRSLNVRQLLLEIAGPGPSLSRSDYARILNYRSKARRAVRLQAFNVDENALGSFFESIQVPDVPVSSVKVLVGDFGSGKSECAEIWHRQEIKAYSDEEGALPIWLHASHLRDRAIEEVIEAQYSSVWREGSGASMVVDGLDETDPARAYQILDEARILVRTYPHLRVLMTARAGLFPESSIETEVVLMPLLSLETALALVQELGGARVSIRTWSSSLQASVRRPFFALSAGKVLAEDIAVPNEIELIRRIVEESLQQGIERHSVTSDKIFTVLRKLSVSLTMSDESTLSFSEQQIANLSRLTTETHDGQIRFSLPIFEQWFAAQSLLLDEELVKQILINSSVFMRWRWVMPLAIRCAHSSQAIDELLSTWVIQNPGVVSWILKTAFGTNHDWRKKGDDRLDPITTGERFLRVYRTWCNSFGDMSVRLALPVMERPVSLGVALSEHSVRFEFRPSGSARDHVYEIASGTHPSRTVDSPLLVIRGGLAAGDAWPWIMLWRMMAREVENLLLHSPYLGSDDGVWIEEHRYDLADRIVDEPPLLMFGRRLSADKAKLKAQKLLERLEDAQADSIAINRSRPYARFEISEFIEWLDQQASGYVTSGLPGYAGHDSLGGYLFKFESKKQFMEFEVLVFERACLAYEEAINHTFKSLGWSLSSSVLVPFGVVLEVVFEPERAVTNRPFIEVTRVPLSLLADLAPGGADSLWSPSGRAVMVERHDSSEGLDYSQMVQQIRSRLMSENREPIAGLSWSSSVAEEMDKRRPASHIAIEWLWKDFEELGLVRRGRSLLR
ncbi:hypothetical protein [Enteractinococcus coprophilus]|uniref:hypothetical protein n=1 Tax=Enteractinococcus coprophilus TaxID=1027633 RepID=UPI00115125B0|nr:hypothetical protein [Enteractinococcus coprophilus]